MDAFLVPVVVLVGIGTVIGALVLLARLYPGSGADLLDWRPTRPPDVEARLETEDVQQMIDAQNEYRRRRGVAEITEQEVRESVAREERWLADHERRGD